jgi:hypothetical protein
MINAPKLKDLSELLSSLDEAEASSEFFVFDGALALVDTDGNAIADILTTESDGFVLKTR